MAFGTKMKTTSLTVLSLGIVFLSAQPVARAADTYYQVPVPAVKAAEGAADETRPGARPRRGWTAPALRWHAVLDGDGEVYINDPDLGRRPWMPAAGFSTNATISVCTPQPAEITGRVFFSKPGQTNATEIQFKVTPADARPEAKNAFFQAKENFYRQLLNRNSPGAAWFRHQLQEAQKGRGVSTNRAPDFAARAARQRPAELEDTFDLFSGGRAISENLQLDRVLPAATATNEDMLDLTNLAGVSIRAMDWKPLLKDAKPDLDPLAPFIPADQHAIFFPSFQAMSQMIDEADANGTPVLELFEARAEDANSRGRYQKQLCLGLSDLSRLLGPQVVASAAFTGSDPFLRVGTDVAVLFEARNADLLKNFIAAQQKAVQAAGADVKSVSGVLDGVAYAGVVTPDRSVSSYLASVTNVVIVCNSLKQLETLVRVAQGKAPALSTQDEYRYFRSRYARSDKQETAFLVLSDATIRRWCGPRWRIADSRRTRAAAVMSELQAGHLMELAAGQATNAVLTSDFKLPDAGEWRLTRAGVASATYGSLNFMTPIAELPLDRVTRAEAGAYQRWCDSYQRNWRQFFDPIAVRFTVQQHQLGAELTVTPLILATDYGRYIEFSSGAQIAPNAGDPHTNTLLHLVFAINTQSQPIQEAGGFVGTMVPGLKANPFGWMGQSLALYADDDPFWDRLNQATNTDVFLEHNYKQLPLALHVEVGNPLGLAAFLTAVHAYADQSAPQMTIWQNLEYNGQPYVKIAGREPDAENESENYAVYYAATPRALIVTLNEPLLKQALDRAAARTGNKQTNQPTAGAKSWLGTSLCAKGERKLFDVVQNLTQDNYQERLQSLSWDNLSILNEWKRLFPGKDPVKVHEALWGVKLVDPAGGTYVWNEKLHTMESTMLGNPLAPKTSPGRALSEVTGAQLGVTFENQGLSAKAILDRK
jgi:hypothetical protein